MSEEDARRGHVLWTVDVTGHPKRGWFLVVPPEHTDGRVIVYAVCKVPMSPAEAEEVFRLGEELFGVVPGDFLKIGP